MVEWVKVRSVDPLKAFEKAVAEEVQTTVAPKTKKPSTLASNTSKMTSSSSILGKERFAKLLSELAISERQKRELQISLEKENEKRSEIERNAQELTGNLTELRIKYEKSMAYLKIVKRWIEKQKKRKESQEQSETKKTTATLWESQIVPVIQEEIGKIKGLLENLNKKEHVACIGKSAIEPEGFQMRVVDSSSSTSASSPISLKLFPASPLQKLSDLAEEPQNITSRNNQAEPTKEYKSVLQDTLDQLVLQEKILEQQERIKRNQRLISESKGIQTEIVAAAAEQSQTSEPECERKKMMGDHGLSSAQIENIVKVKLKEELKKRQRHRPLYNRTAVKPIVRPAKNQTLPIDEKKFQYDSDSSSMVTSLADLLDDLDIPKTENVKDRLFRSKGADSRNRHQNQNSQVEMYESRGSSIDEALERVIKQLNVL